MKGPEACFVSISSRVVEVFGGFVLDGPVGCSGGREVEGKKADKGEQKGCEDGEKPTPHAGSGASGATDEWTSGKLEVFASIPHRLDGP